MPDRTTFSGIIASIENPDRSASADQSKIDGLLATTSELCTPHINFTSTGSRFVELFFEVSEDSASATVSEPSPIRQVENLLFGHIHDHAFSNTETPRHALRLQIADLTSGLSHSQPSELFEEAAYREQFAICFRQALQTEMERREASWQIYLQSRTHLKSATDSASSAVAVIKFHISAERLPLLRFSSSSMPYFTDGCTVPVVPSSPSGDEDENGGGVRATLHSSSNTTNVSARKRSLRDILHMRLRRAAEDCFCTVVSSQET